MSLEDLFGSADRIGKKLETEKPNSEIKEVSTVIIFPFLVRLLAQNFAIAKLGFLAKLPDV